MNTLMYDALKNAGVKEKDARAAAIEAGRNDLCFQEESSNKIQAEMELYSSIRIKEKRSTYYRICH